MRAHRASISSKLTGALQRADTQGLTAGRMRSDSNLSGETEKQDHEIRHSVEPKALVTILPPVLVSSAPYAVDIC